jgi:catechol 2,3-dioxygenase-like lactoylglutathione lyase family enzyme|tara:strand:+ start:1724 stop:2110 length:387 start_codon:yes stop_codon:yes gene_type:complete
MAVKNIAALDHINILTNDVEKCRNFYVDGLGFEEGFRPPMDIPGIWLYLAAHPVVHIIEMEETLSNTTGNIDHIAFRAYNFNTFTKNLNDKGIEWSDREIPSMDIRQLFVHDPHGVKIEFNFSTKEEL